MKISPSIAAVVDQIANSGVTFVCAIALMFWGYETAFAAFGLLSTYLALVSGVQASLVGSPVQVLAGRLDESEKSSLLTRAAIYQFWAACVFGLLVILLLAICSLAFEVNIEGIGATLFAVLVFWMRDFQRTRYIVLGQSAHLLFTSLWSLGAAALIISGSLMIDGRVSFTEAVIALALPQFIALIRPILGVCSAGRKVEAGAFATLVHQLWPLSGWAVLGGVVIWIQNQAHLSLAAAMAGISAVAALAAGRLMVSPAMSAAGGLNRMNLSRFGAEFRRAGLPALHAAKQRAVRSVLVLHGSYLALILAAWLMNLDRLLPPNYRDIWPLVMLWYLFSAVASVRGCITAAIQMLDGFRWMFKLSAWGCALSLVLTIGGYSLYPLVYFFVLAPLLTEILLIALASVKYRRLASGSELSI